MKSSKTRSLKAIARPLWTNVMKSLPGWMPIKLLKRMNTKTNKRTLKESATQSLPNCIKLLEVNLVACPEACLVECPVPVEPLDPDLDLLLKKLIRKADLLSLI